jgi:hypothetical protein
MYAKADSLLRHVDSSSAERLADTFHCIGSELLSREDHSMALKWLRRALNIIKTQELERLSTEGLELRMSIHHELIQALLAIDSEEHLEEADNLVSQVESEMGDKPIVLHWKLEIIQRFPGELFDADEYASILRRMIRSLTLSDRLAVGLMEELIAKKLIPCGNVEWVGKAVVRRVWMGTMEADTSKGVGDLVRLLDQVIQEIGQCNVEASTAVFSASPLTISLHSCVLLTCKSSFGRESMQAMPKSSTKNVNSGVKQRFILFFFIAAKLLRESLVEE